MFPRRMYLTCQRTLRARYVAVARVGTGGLAQRLGGRLEDRLGDVVIVRAVRDRDVEVHLGAGRDGLEELLDQFDGERADRAALELHLEHERRTPGEVDRDLREALVHRHRRPAIAEDAAL